MSTVASPSKPVLDNTQREWLKQMASALEVKLGGAQSPAPGAPEPKTGQPAPPPPGTPAPAPPSSAKRPILRTGSKGQDVKDAQTLLNKNGATLNVDGDFGKLTDEAVKAFQKKNPPLVVDGIIGPKTWPVLEASKPEPPKPDPPKPPDTKPRKAVFTVTNVENNNAIAGAAVKLGELAEKTGNTGQATISIPPGSYPYVVTADGFEEAKGTFEVKPDEESKKSVELKSSKPAQGSTTTLTVSPAGKAGRGDKVEMTATVTMTGGGAVPAGVVRFTLYFKESSRIKLTEETVKNGKATFSWSKFPVGKHFLQAAYKPEPPTKDNPGSESEKVPYEIELGKRGEYEDALKAVMPKYEETQLKAREYQALDARKLELQTIYKDMETAAKAGDYDRAKQLVTVLSTKADEYLKAGAEIQKEIDKKGFEINKSLDKAGYFERDNIARDWVNNKLNENEIKHLPTQVRNRLVEELQGGRFSGDDKKAVDKLYKVRTLDPEFEKAEKVMRDKMVEALKKDPDLAREGREWPTMSVEKRLAFMQKLANYHTEAYGTTDIKGAPKLKVVKKEEAKKADGTVNMGTYNHGSGEFELNIHPDNPALTSFNAAIDLAAHEAGHRYQAMLAKQYKDGKIKKGDPLYDQARAFYLNDSYYPTKPFSVYSNQPQEAHSRISGAAVAEDYNK